MALSLIITLTYLLTIMCHISIDLIIFEFENKFELQTLSRSKQFIRIARHYFLYLTILYFSSNQIYLMLEGFVSTLSRPVHLCYDLHMWAAAASVEKKRSYSKHVIRRAKKSQLSWQDSKKWKDTKKSQPMHFFR